ncbi:MAG: DUF1109 domain-containing protein [Asticcacaulis sp.]
MTEPKHDMIDHLTDNLRPVHPLRNDRLWAGAVAGLLLAYIYIYVLCGFRPEIMAMTKGVWPGHLMPIVKPLLFLGLGVCALAAVARLTRPEGQMKGVYLLPVMVSFGVILTGTIIGLMTNSPEITHQQLDGGGPVCFTTILCGGTVGLVLLWRFWLRKSASSHPVALAAMSGLAVSSLMASAYALRCNMDSPIYLLVFYGMGLLIMTNLSAWLGRYFLRW